MSSHLATQQQLHRAIHPQPIPRIRNPQRLSRLVSRKPHLDNAMDSFPRRVLIRWGVEDIDLRWMLVGDVREFIGLLKGLLRTRQST